MQRVAAFDGRKDEKVGDRALRVYPLLSRFLYIFIVARRSYTYRHFLSVSFPIFLYLSLAHQLYSGIRRSRGVINFNFSACTTIDTPTLPSFPSTFPASFLVSRLIHSIVRTLCMMQRVTKGKKKDRR